MIRKNVFKKVGVFAMTVMLAATPLMAVNAAEGTQLFSSSKGSSLESELETPVQTPDQPETPEKPATPEEPAATEKPATPEKPAATEKPAADSGASVSSDSSSSEKDDDNYVVATSAGSKLVSTVKGSYIVSCVPGVAFTTPKSQLPADLSVLVCNSARGDKAATSINDGLAILAANGVSAVKGPEVDINAYIKGAKTIDFGGTVTVAFGIPADFKQAGYDYAVILVQEGGRVSILPDTKADPACITVNTSGAGVYVLVKAPAGSFDKFR